MSDFTTFFRAYVGVLLVVSLAISMVANTDPQHGMIPMLVVISTPVFAFYAALPVLALMAVGWVLLGGLRK